MKTQGFIKGRLIGGIYALALALGTPAFGEIYLVDFGTSAGRQGSPDGQGNTWNNLTGTVGVASSLTALNNIVDSSGGASTIDVSMSGWDGANTWNSGLTPDSNLNGGLFALTAVSDDGAYFTAAQAPTMTIGGLDMSLTYDLVFYGARRDSVRYTTYSVSGAGSVELQTGYNPGWNSDTVVSLNGISPDAGGIIIVNLIGYTGAGQTGSRTFGYLNGLEIQSNPAIPEPGTLALLGLGVSSVILFKRRRR